MSDDVLKEIEDFAYKYMTREEIGLITGVDPADIKDQESEAGKAFLIGRLKRKAEFNGNVIQLSKQLSSPAMVIESKLAESAYLNDLRKR